MKLLAFDTSTETLSLALTDGACVWRHSGVGGVRASAALIPAIQALMAQARLRYRELDAIAFGAGPGSFTGLRTACSVAQGLAFGAGLRVLPIDSLLAVAEDARFSQGTTRVLAALDARMDQLYVARYEFANGAFTRSGDFALVAPEALRLDGHTLAGNVAAAYRGRLADEVLAGAVDALPTADAMLRLAPRLIANGALVAPERALPHYVRDKVAQTTLERADAAREASRSKQEGAGRPGDERTV